jgi:hypothetical protein
MFGLAMFYFSDICFSLKVYTRESDAVISESFTLKFRYYKDNVISNALREELSEKLSALKKQVCAFYQTIRMYALKLLRDETSSVLQVKMYVKIFVSK